MIRILQYCLFMTLIFAIWMGCESGDEPSNWNVSDGDGSGDTDSDNDSDSDSDSDNDSDSDSDSDGDSDSDSDGDSDSDSDGDSDVCAQEDFPIEAAPVRLMILQDISGSMADGNPTKWVQARQALTNMLNQFDNDLQFGFDVFPNDGNCGVNQPVKSDTAPNNAANIISQFPGINPEGATPLLGAMKKFLSPNYAQNFLSTDATSYLLVVSDGDDTCAGGIFAMGATAVQLGNTSADLLAQMEVQTFVIGFGGGSTPAKLNAIAKNGGTGQQTFLDAMNQQQLEQALQSVGSSVVSCVYEIATKDDDPAVNMEEVNFYFDDAVVGWDDGCANGKGWQWVDDQKSAVEFCPEACAQLQNGDVENISATFGCPTEIVQ